MPAVHLQLLVLRADGYATVSDSGLLPCFPFALAQEFMARPAGSETWNEFRRRLKAL